MSAGNLEVDLNRHLALVEGESLPLTGKEFRIVEFLALRKGSVLSKTAFLSHLYGGMDEPEPKIIDVFICKLRRKLEICLLYTSPSPRDRLLSRMPSSA